MAFVKSHALTQFFCEGLKDSNIRRNKLLVVADQLFSKQNASARLSRTA